MPSATRWRPLDEFRDSTVPKLGNLRTAARAGLTVPETFWAWAADLEAAPPDRLPDGVPEFPRIVRSGSPTEDTATTSNAGRFLSEVVERPEDFAGAVGRVVGALPRAGDGRRLGVVFVQPWLRAEAAGVTFFDGFYFEEAWERGGNAAVTSGRSRGQVRRGHVQRGDAHHEWLLRVHRVFGGTVDLEWAVPSAHPGRPVLLQARPALFPVARCQTLSLANHKEILGDPPSPWMVGTLAEVGRPVMRFYERLDSAVAAWDEVYAVELGERAWMNFSAFFRLMDHWGMPRTMVTDGVGGEAAGPLDAHYLPGRYLRFLPRLPWVVGNCLATLARIGRGLRGLDAALERAGTLEELRRVNVAALEFSVRTNFAIMSLLSVVMRVRRVLGLDQAASVVTQRMMGEYAVLAARPEAADRLAGLDAWLAKYGHRGPLESDPMRPRFAELRDVLRADLGRGAAPPPAERPQPSVLVAALARPLFWLDEVRESFRDRLMRWWQRLRGRILAAAAAAVAAGHLDAPDDAFFLRADDLAAPPETWRGRAAARRARVEAVRHLDLPATAPRDALESALARARRPGAGEGPDRFVGIGLGQEHVLGTAVRARELTAVLDGAALPESPVLVVDTLEPSWAVVFPRFSAVVAELGGELSHASILLREAGIPAVVNARGAFRSIADGDLVRVDPAAGEVRVEARHPHPHANGTPAPPPPA